MDITHLLYIDDDPDDYEFFSEAIADLLPDTRITWLTHCNNLPAFLQVNQIDIIFLDFHLPKITGKECLALIRQQDKCRDIQVVFYSATSPYELSEIPKEHNVYFMSKPYTYEQLKQQLAQFFRSHEMLKG